MPSDSSKKQHCPQSLTATTGLLAGGLCTPEPFGQLKSKQDPCRSMSFNVEPFGLSEPVNYSLGAGGAAKGQRESLLEQETQYQSLWPGWAAAGGNYFL